MADTAWDSDDSARVLPGALILAAVAFWGKTNVHCVRLEVVAVWHLGVWSCPSCPSSTHLLSIGSHCMPCYDRRCQIAWVDLDEKTSARTFAALLSDRCHRGHINPWKKVGWCPLYVHSDLSCGGTLSWTSCNHSLD